MTGARQQRKPWFSLALALGLAGAATVSPETPRAAFDQHVEINPQTGLAISGFDPVAYFAEQRPVFGRADFELPFEGTVWRFENPGNRAAFLAHPEVYSPRFGGYDPVAIARGASVPGHPLVWTVMSQRLYFFYDEKTRAEFLSDPGRVLEQAGRQWPAVARTIAH